MYMEFGLNFEKLLLIGLIAVLIIGPERLPMVAEKFAGFVKRAGEYVRDTKSKMRDEIGPEIDDVDWRKLDPRQYDPRRIIRDALMDDSPVKPVSAVQSAAVTATAVATAAPSASSSRTPLVRPEFTRDDPPPYDREAT